MPCGIRAVALDGRAQHGGAQGAQQLGDDAVRLLIDLLQQPGFNLGPDSDADSDSNLDLDSGAVCGVQCCGLLCVVVVRDCGACVQLVGTF